MSAVEIAPGRVEGTARAPPSKSYTHRALIAAHFGARPFRVLRPLDADDTRASRRAVEALGAQVRNEDGTWVVEDPGGSDPPGETVIDCGRSGTTLRLFSAVAATQARPVRFEGDPQLARRPMSPLLGCLALAGVRVERLGDDGRSLPVRLTGPLRAGDFELTGTESSQFLSALLLALPTAGGASRVKVTGAQVSRPYLEATLAVLRHQGIEIRPLEGGYEIPGGQTYTGDRFEVPGDASSAAYLWAAGAVTGGRVTVTGVPPNWPQADRRVLELLADWGADVRAEADSVTVSGIRPGHGFEVDLSDAPDLYPLAGVLASFAREGTSELRGAEHVRFKESDRREETVRLARALGAHVRETPTGVEIRGADRPSSLAIKDSQDHRVVMSAAVGALAASGRSTIADARAVAKSFPAFWSTLESLGAEVRPLG
jgi:3-phosphoshikimate 1-carboxyvinyltransferase